MTETRSVWSSVSSRSIPLLNWPTYLPPFVVCLYWIATMITVYLAPSVLNPSPSSLTWDRLPSFSMRKLWRGILQLSKHGTPQSDGESNWPRNVTPEPSHKIPYYHTNKVRYSLPSLEIINSTIGILWLVSKANAFLKNKSFREPRVFFFSKRSSHWVMFAVEGWR